MEKKQPKKLVLNKERITQLSNQEMKNVLGGGSASTRNSFTCSWCTSGSSPNVTIKTDGSSISVGDIPINDNVSIGGSVGNDGGGFRVTIRF